MSPTLNGSSAIRRFERSNAVEIRDGITFDFYTGLPHIYLIEDTVSAISSVQGTNCSADLKRKNTIEEVSVVL